MFGSAYVTSLPANEIDDCYEKYPTGPNNPSWELRWHVLIGVETRCTASKLEVMCELIN